jgi:hypothetical protein
MMMETEMPNLEMLESSISRFRKIIQTEKKDLTKTQIESFISAYNIRLTKNLEKSYFSLVSKLDDETVRTADILHDQFIIKLLKASGFKKEKELKRITMAFCDFLVGAGTKNTTQQQMLKQDYSLKLKNAVGVIESQNSMEWIANLKERLDTKNYN